MAEEASNKIQGAMAKLVEELHKGFLRTMQKDMHLCAARCCDNQSLSVEKLHHCVETCQFPVTKAETFIQKELSEFQERLQRCVLVCQDKVRDKVTANSTESQVEVYKAEFESCALRCVDDHVALMPSIKRRISTALSNS